MSDIKEYKCPACGGTMEFDSASQKMKCPYCDTEISVEEYEALNEPQMSDDQKSGQTEKNTQRKDTKERNLSKEQKQDQNPENQDETKESPFVTYICESCGGEITADKTTGATTCPFCGNRVVLKGKFEGNLKPDYVIPFKLDKKAAKAAYQEHLEGKAFVPAVFKEENHIDEIVGIYVPFWLFDMETNAFVTYDAERSRVWMSGDVEYTEHEFFQVERGGTMAFEHIPEDGSKKMDDDLMESLEPYDFKDAVPFKDPYLAGYVAERYDVEAEECKKRAKKRAKASIKRELRDTVNGYSIVKPVTDDIKVQKASHKYALYPVWILNTTWRNQKYVFAMNGQTGKMVGDLPADKGAFWKYVISRGAVIGVILYALMWLRVLL